MGPNRVLGPHRVFGPHRVHGPHRVLGPPRVLGLAFRYMISFKGFHLDIVFSFLSK